MPDPNPTTYKINDKSGYLYYVDNETRDGLEFPYIPYSAGKPLICDMTSNFATREFDMRKFGIVFGSS